MCLRCMSLRFFAVSALHFASQRVAALRPLQRVFGRLLFVRVPKGRVLFCNDPARGRRYRTQVAVTVADSGVDERINAGLNPAR